MQVFSCYYFRQMKLIRYCEFKEYQHTFYDERGSFTFNWHCKTCDCTQYSVPVIYQQIFTNSTYIVAMTKVVVQNVSSPFPNTPLQNEARPINCFPEE